MANRIVNHFERWTGRISFFKSSTWKRVKSLLSTVIPSFYPQDWKSGKWSEPTFMWEVVYSPSLRFNLLILHFQAILNYTKEEEKKGKIQGTCQPHLSPSSKASKTSLPSTPSPPSFVYSPALEEWLDRRSSHSQPLSNRHLSASDLLYPDHINDNHAYQWYLEASTIAPACSPFWKLNERTCAVSGVQFWQASAWSKWNVCWSWRVVRDDKLDVTKL